MAAQRREQDLTLREAAAAVGLSVGTIRAHIRAGRLTPPQVTGKWGPEYRIRPAVLTAFAAERLGLKLDAAALRRPRQGATGETLSDSSRELYERLLLATEEATRFKALAEVSESAREAAATEYGATVAELTHERDAARAEAEEAAAELERVRSRGWWARTFGGAG